MNTLGNTLLYLGQKRSRRSTIISWLANPTPPASITNAPPWDSYWSLSNDIMTLTADTTPNPSGGYSWAVNYSGGLMTASGLNFVKFNDVGSVHTLLGTRGVTYTANLNFSHNTGYGPPHMVFNFGLSDGLLMTGYERYVGFSSDNTTGDPSGYVHLRSVKFVGMTPSVTDITTTVLPNDTPHVFKFTINAAGTLITWYIDGVQVGTSTDVPDYDIPMMFYWTIPSIYIAQSFDVTSIICEC